MDYAKAPEFTNTYTREQYGWLCDIVNQYGDKKGFPLIEEKFEKTQDLTAKAMAEFCFYTRSLFIEERATDNVILDESSI